MWNFYVGLSTRKSYLGKSRRNFDSQPASCPWQCDNHSGCKLPYGLHSHLTDESLILRLGPQLLLGKGHIRAYLEEVESHCKQLSLVGQRRNRYIPSFTTHKPLQSLPNQLSIGSLINSSTSTMPPKIKLTKRCGKKKRKTKAQLDKKREAGFWKLCGGLDLGSWPPAEEGDDKEGEWEDEDDEPLPPYQSPQKKSDVGGSNKRGAVSTPPSYLAGSPPGRVHSSRDILDAAHGRSGTGLEGNTEKDKLAEPVALDFDAQDTNTRSYRIVHVDMEHRLTGVIIHHSSRYSCTSS